MAELAALGSAASIVQFIAIACKVAERINTYCSAVANIPEVFRQLKTALPLLIDLCDRYKGLPHVSCRQAVKDALAECERHIADLDRCLVKAIPADHDSNPAKWMKALKSFGLEAKVKESISRLDVLQSALHFDLAITTYTDTILRPPASSESDRKCICIPSGRLAKFFGRTKLLDLIDASLKPGGRDPKVCVLQGMGGQGKTSLALEYCKRERSSGYFKSILWVEAKSLGAVHRSFAHFAECLTNNQRRFADNKACVHQVQQTLQTWATPWLVVYDNYDRLSDLPGVLDYLPSSEHGAVLVTSRHPGCAFLGDVIQISGMELDESIQFFLARVGMEPSPKNVESATKVVTTLGNLPLAIDQSAAYIRARKISPREFLSHYKTRRLKVMKYIPEMSTYKGLERDSVEDEDKPLSVFTTWELSRDQIWRSNNTTKEHADAIAHFLTTLSFFGNLNLRMDMFRVYFETKAKRAGWMEIFRDPDTEEWDNLACQDVVSNLEQLWLIRYQDHHPHDLGIEDENAQRVVSIHPLVQSWIQLRLEPDARRSHCIEALHILYEYIRCEDPTRGPVSLKQRRETLSHLDSALEWQDRYIARWSSDDWHSLREPFAEFMRYYIKEGKYNEAESVCKSLLMADAARQSDVAAMIFTQVDLAAILIGQGRYSDAEHLILQTKATRDTVPRNIATDIHLARTLGLCYFKQGRYTESEASYRDALSEEHATPTSRMEDGPDTNELLARVCRELGKHDEAMRLYQSALESYAAKSAVLRQLECKVHLANTYRALARNSEAAVLTQQAHEGLLERLGHDHPLVVEAKMYNGINCIALATYPLASRLLDQAVKLASKVLGPHHPVSLKAMMNLAKSLQYEGEIAKAESLYRVVLEGREQTLGPLNPYTLRTCEDLVSLLCTQELFDEAESIAERFMQVHGRSPAERDPVLQRLRAVSLDSAVAMTDEESHMFPATELLFDSGVARCATTLDVAHRDRIDLQEALVGVYERQGRATEASHLRQQMANDATRAGAQRV